MIDKLTRFFDSTRGQALIAEVEQADSEQRQRLLDELASAKQDESEIVTRHQAEIDAARRAVREAETTLENARLDLRRETHALTAARYPAQRRIELAESRLRALLSIAARAAIGQLDGAIEKARDDLQSMTGDAAIPASAERLAEIATAKTRYSRLVELRSAANGWHLLHEDELAAELRSVDELL